MSTNILPAKLTLPSGLVVQLRFGKLAGRAPITRPNGTPLFGETARAIASGWVTITANGKPLEVDALALKDFHVLRAVLTRSGVIGEDEIEVSCRNCGEALHVRPCAALEIGPWVDGEADDVELDATQPFGEAIDVPTIPLGRVRGARTVTFADRTVSDAQPLFVAAAREPLDVTAELVRAMGIVSLGTERKAEKIAEALAQCDNEGFRAIGEAFLASHYVPRLGSVVFCKGCGARNDVDAPYERELRREEGRGPEASREGERMDTFPGFEAFAARAREIGRPMTRELAGQGVELVVDGGTPAVDDGGEPLLGSYLPAHPGDATTPTRAPSVTVYYRTFHAVWNDEGPYDWDAELIETIAHELDHHLAFLRGDDPMDDEERAVIVDEAVRIVGRREAGRRVIEGFGASFCDFLVRTWPLWVLALVALAFMLATQR